MNYQELFEESYGRVIGAGVRLGDKGKEFFDRFYNNFFANSREVRDKFTDVDMAAQVAVLQKSMFHVVSFYVTKTDTDYLMSIARSHSRTQYNIKPELYDIWLESLIETVEAMDPKYEDELALAWRLAMIPGIEFMKFHY